MKSIAKIIVLVVVFTSITSCMLTGVKGNQNVTTEDRTIKSDFDGIKVSQGINLFLIQGDELKISVETDENLQDILKTEVNKGNVLEVYFDEQVRKATAKNVYVTAKNINFLRTSSGASLTAEDVINSEAVQIETSSGSSIRVELLANDITSSSSSGSSIKVIGKTNNLTAKASSGSSIRAHRLEAEVVEAKASSGANIEVNALEELVASASSGGSIDYEGTPKKLVKNTSSGGSVHKN